MRPHAQSRSDLIDGLIDLYVDWRQESAAVRSAYERWSLGPAEDRALAFAAYGAALDREESASRVYAEQLDRIGPGQDVDVPGGELGRVRSGTR